MTDGYIADDAVIPPWQISGDWFDVCSCNVPCPCTFAQAPTGNACEVLFTYRITEGHFGETSMDGLKVVMLASLVGNVWEGAKLDACVFFDAAGDPQQQRALEMITDDHSGCALVAVLRAREFFTNRCRLYLRRRVDGSRRDNRSQTVKRPLAGTPIADSRRTWSAEDAVVLDT